MMTRVFLLSVSMMISLICRPVIFSGCDFNVIFPGSAVTLLRD